RPLSSHEGSLPVEHSASWPARNLCTRQCARHDGHIRRRTRAYILRRRGKRRSPCWCACIDGTSRWSGERKRAVALLEAAVDLLAQRRVAGQITGARPARGGAAGEAELLVGEREVLEGAEERRAEGGGALVGAHGGAEVLLLRLHVAEQEVRVRVEGIEVSPRLHGAEGVVELAHLVADVRVRPRAGHAIAPLLVEGRARRRLAEHARDQLPQVVDVEGLLDEG